MIFIHISMTFITLFNLFCRIDMLLCFFKCREDLFSSLCLEEFSFDFFSPIIFSFEFSLVWHVFLDSNSIGQVNKAFITLLIWSIEMIMAPAFLVRSFPIIRPSVVPSALLLEFFIKSFVIFPGEFLPSYFDSFLVCLYFIDYFRTSNDSHWNISKITLVQSSFWCISLGPILFKNYFYTIFQLVLLSFWLYSSPAVGIKH